MIKYLQIEKQFDVDKLQADVQKLEETAWKQHYNTAHYEGRWSILPLRSINGSLDNVAALHAPAGDALHQYHNTVLLASCNYLQEVLHFFQCEITTVRLMKLHAGAVIKAHRDMALSYEEGEVRLHIPVTTNKDVQFFLEGEQVSMQEGTCWYLNLSLLHWVHNKGNADRIHLVIDCKVNSWLQALFARPALQCAVQNPPSSNNHSTKAEKEKIIQELRLLNTPTALQLAAQLEKEQL